MKKIQKNSSNHFISINDIENIYKQYDININIDNVELYQEAFVHSSISNKNNYERLEFFGDSIINMFCSEYLYINFPNSNEGLLTKFRSDIVNGKYLSNIAKKIKLDKFIIYSINMEHKFNGRENDKILGDIFESFIGACYINEGYLICKELLNNILISEIDINNITIKNNNYKGELSSYYQKLYNKTPYYKIKEQNGPNHKKIYIIEVFDNNDTIIGMGEDKTKKGAEINAAYNALIKLNII